MLSSKPSESLLSFLFIELAAEHYLIKRDDVPLFIWDFIDGGEPQPPFIRLFPASDIYTQNWYK